MYVQVMVKKTVQPNEDEELVTQVDRTRCQFLEEPALEQVMMRIAANDTGGEVWRVFGCTISDDADIEIGEEILPTST